MKQIIFITGTDTGVGKTVLTAALVKFLRDRDVNAAALKPICSGGRDDARHIFNSMDGAISLDEINPWHCRTPIAPLLAARHEKKQVKLRQVIAHIRKIQKRFDILLIEGAGGLLSPLGEKFNSRDLILALAASPIIVAQNKLGVVNHILLTLEALPENVRNETKIVLTSPRKPDAATKTNSQLIAEFFGGKIFTLPWFNKDFEIARLRETFRALTEI